MHHSLANLRYAGNTRTPYVITPRGMLDPWALGRAAWKKRLVGLWFERAHLRGAACLRAISLSEAKAMRAFGLTNPIAVVPNGVTLPTEEPADADRAEPQTLLFLGRLDPKKGVVELLRAWREVEREARDRGWRLQVSGWGEPAYVARVEDHARTLELDPTTFSLTGPLYGADKARAFATASAFVLPSFSEGLPMAVLEAWSYRLPSVLSDHCNLPEGFAAGAALRTETAPSAIAASLRELFALDPQQRHAMGLAGRRLVENDFTWDAVAGQMTEVYRWVVGGGTPPACVLTD